jgi:bifunctional NMN adenylyltransferase/nudix hydrolase
MQITAALLDLDENIFDRVRIVPIKDIMYDNKEWLSRLENQVDLVADIGTSKVLVGHDKDESSWYLKHFPTWKTHEVENFDNIDAIKIRDFLFHNALNWEKLVPPVNKSLLQANAKKEWFRILSDENEEVRNYKDEWSESPYPPTLVTADSIVEFNDKVLIVKRGGSIGNGKFALPGGFVDGNELLLNTALRELFEETSVNVSSEQLINHLDSVHVYDHPYRSVLGRVITHVHHFSLVGLESDGKDDLEVRPGDDAIECGWYPLNEIRDTFEPLMFDDHYYILKQTFGW